MEELVTTTREKETGLLLFSPEASISGDYEVQYHQNGVMGATWEVSYATDALYGSEENKLKQPHHYTVTKHTFGGGPRTSKLIKIICNKKNAGKPLPESGNTLGKTYALAKARKEAIRICNVLIKVANSEQPFLGEVVMSKGKPMLIRFIPGKNIPLNTF